MRKLVIILFLLCLGQVAQSQKRFVNLPSYSSNSVALVMDAVQLNNNYYFNTAYNYYSGATHITRYSIYKTDLQGNLLDSINIQTPNTDSVIGIQLGTDKDKLVLYKMHAIVDTVDFFYKIKLGRIRYDENFNPIDSFLTVTLNNNFFRGYSFWLAKKFNSRIYYVIKGIDTNLYNLNYSYDRVYPLDTLGNFILEKKKPPYFLDTGFLNFKIL